MPGDRGVPARVHQRPGTAESPTAGKFFDDGQTPLYDAIAKGIELLEGVEGKRAIVVMTDGAETSSRPDHPSFWRRLQEKHIWLYTIGLGAELRTYQPEIASSGGRVLRHASMATNGRFFFAHTAEELQGLYQQITDELGTLSTYYVRPTPSRGTGRLNVVTTGGSGFLSSSRPCLRSSSMPPAQ